MFKSRFNQDDNHDQGDNDGQGDDNDQDDEDDQNNNDDQSTDDQSNINITEFVKTCSNSVNSEKNQTVTTTEGHGVNGE